MNEPFLVVEHDLIGEAFALEVKNGILYLANGYSGIYVFDISTITTPIELTHLVIGGFSEELEIRDEIIYLSVSGLGLLAIKTEGLTTTNEGYGFTLFFVFLAILFPIFKSKFLKYNLSSSNWRKK